MVGSVRAVAVVAVLAVVGAACDSSTSVPVLEPEVVERVEVCEDLVPIGAELVRRLTEAVEGAPLEMMTGDAPPSEELAGLRSIGVEIDLRAARLGCDAAALNAAINLETVDLVTEDPVARLFLDVVREGVVGTLPPVPGTTTTAAP